MMNIVLHNPKCLEAVPVESRGRVIEMLRDWQEACRTDNYEGIRPQIPEKTIPWDGHEDHLLRRYYRSNGAKACAAKLPGRSIHAIIGRAFRLGLSEQR